MKVSRNILTVLLLALVACATEPSRQVPARPLLPPASLGAERSANQIVHGAVGTREMTVNCIVTVSRDTMSVVGLSAIGMRLFTIRYDGRDVQVEAGIPLPERLTPEHLLADLQLVFWPLQVLKDAGLDVAQYDSGTRYLRRDGRVIAEAHYGSADPWTARSWLVNFEHDYSLQIDSSAL